MIPAGRPLGPPPSTAKEHQTPPQPDQPDSIKVGSPVRLTIFGSKTNEKSKETIPHQTSQGREETKRFQRERAGKYSLDSLVPEVFALKEKETAAHQ